MKIIVCGGRDLQDRELVYARLDAWHSRERITTLIHGAQRGADTLAGEWAKSRGVPVIEEPVSTEEWKKLGGSAGPIRNRRMLGHKPDRVIAFPGGTGTSDMLCQARAHGVKCVEVC